LVPPDVGRSIEDVHVLRDGCANVIIHVTTREMYTRRRVHPSLALVCANRIAREGCTAARSLQLSGLIKLRVPGFVPNNTHFGHRMEHALGSRFKPRTDLSVTQQIVRTLKLDCEHAYAAPPAVAEAPPRADCWSETLQADA